MRTRVPDAPPLCEHPEDRLAWHPNPAIEISVCRDCDKVFMSPYAWLLDREASCKANARRTWWGRSAWWLSQEHPQIAAAILRAFTWLRLWRPPEATP